MSPIKPKVLTGMTQQERDFFAEWDPRYLQSLKEEPDAQDIQEHDNALVQKQNTNIPHVLRPQLSSTFDEWKAMALQSGRKENAGPLSTPVQHKGTATSTAAGTPSRTRGSEHQRGSTDRPSVSLTASQHEKARCSPPKANSRRNVKTNSSSMIPVLSLKRDDVVVTRHDAVSNRRTEVPSAPAPAGEKSETAAPEIVSSNTCANALTNPTPAEKPEVNTDPMIIARPQPTASKIGGYKAPNGTALNSAALARLSRGVHAQNNDTTYFRPSFVVDPWEKVKVMKTTCLSRSW